MAISERELKTGRPKPARPVVYPTTDGKPMGETDEHINLLAYCREALRVFYADRPDVYVSGNNLLFYVEGDPKKFVSPDTYVVFGVPNHARDSYFTWVEGKAPDVVFEFTSKSTGRDDAGRKLKLYEAWGVGEYFLFDPKAEFLKPPLQGYRLANGAYTRLELAGDRLASENLGLELVIVQRRLRLYDPARGEYLSTLEEVERQRRAALQQANEATERAERESERADEALQRAEREARAYAEAEAEIARLRAELERLRQGEREG